METESQLKGSLEEVDVFDEHVPQPDNIQRVTDEEETSVLLGTDSKRSTRPGTLKRPTFQRSSSHGTLLPRQDNPLRP